MNEKQRNERIKGVIKGIRGSIDNSEDGQLNFCYEDIIKACQSKFFCQRRTAIDYVNVALIEIGLNKEELVNQEQEVQTTFKLNGD